jgi:hypothetical protein
MTRSNWYTSPTAPTVAGSSSGPTLPPCLPNSCSWKCPPKPLEECDCFPPHSLELVLKWHNSLSGGTEEQQERHPVNSWQNKGYNPPSSHRYWQHSIVYTQNRPQLQYVLYLWIRRHQQALIVFFARCLCPVEAPCHSEKCME